MSKKLCAVVNCNNTSKNNMGISFHRFPTDQNVCCQWVKLTQNPAITKKFEDNGLDSVKYKVVCSVYFKNEDFAIFHGVENRMLLYRGAIPSLNLRSTACNQTVLDKTIICCPNVLSPLLKNILKNTNGSAAS